VRPARAGGGGGVLVWDAVNALPNNPLQFIQAFATIITATRYAADADLRGIVLTDDGGGYTYFKLRDVGEALGFNVSWSPGGILIQSGKPYTG